MTRRRRSAASWRGGFHDDMLLRMAGDPEARSAAGSRAALTRDSSVADCGDDPDWRVRYEVACRDRGLDENSRELAEDSATRLVQEMARFALASLPADATAESVRESRMSKIVRDSDVVELTQPPYFNFGEKVRAKRTIRNDGTYAGKEIGDDSLQEGRGRLRRQHRHLPAAILHLCRRIHSRAAIASA